MSLNSYVNISESTVIILNQLLNKIVTSNTTLNNMYDCKYIYTLNKYRELLIQESKIYNIEKHIVDEYLLILIKTNYVPEVETRIQEIEAIPLIEQKTPEWFKQRETMISASDSGYFLKKCGASKAVESLKIKVGLKSYCNSSAPPLMHGNTYEDVARAIYESRNCVSVKEYGILSSPTACIGASPDGIVTKCNIDTYECQSKFGRLLEIKNPYSREIDNTIKPEYMVQILQQQYTTGLPICDFVETTIVDANCHTENSNYKPYLSLQEMLNDKLDKTKQLWENRIKNKNIPNENLNKFGNEKGLVLWYRKNISENDTRHKYILYPLASLYETAIIEKWIVDTHSEQFSQGYQYVSTKYWRLDVYSEKTVIYDQKLFEEDYVPKLCKIWDIISQCKNKDVIKNFDDLSKFIEDQEADKESPFYNENKRKKKVNNDLSSRNGNSSYNSYFKSAKPNKDIILDF